MMCIRLWIAAAALGGLWIAGCGGSSSPPVPTEGLLFSETLGDDGGTELPGISAYAAALGVETFPGSMSYPEVFEDDILTPASEGAVIVVVEEDDIEFAALVELLTNGADDKLRLRLDRDTGLARLSNKQESEYDFLVDRRGAPDLQGYPITRFELHVEELRFEVPGHDPNSNGNWQDRFVEVRLEIYGMR